MKTIHKTMLLLLILCMALPISCTCDSDDDDDDNDTSDDDDATDDDDDDSDDDDDTTPPVSEGFVYIPAGTFMMGSPYGQPGRRDSREPRYEVTLTNEFEIMQTEVTQQQYEGLTSENPSSDPACGLECPVDQITWWMAVEFANLMSEENGYEPCYLVDTSGPTNTIELNGVATVYDCEGYRLPTDAEWEYAAKSGVDDTGFYNGLEADSGECYEPSNLDSIGWSCHNSDNAFHTVAQLLPNNWDIHDMLGNVEEWVFDKWKEFPTDSIDPDGEADDADPSKRTIKGGTFKDTSLDCRTSSRFGFITDYQFEGLGFRLARTL